MIEVRFSRTVLTRLSEKAFTGCAVPKIRELRPETPKPSRPSVGEDGIAGRKTT
jgi:hypothetical protein